MPEAIMSPSKRALADATNNVGLSKSASVLKKRKLDNEGSVQLPSSQAARRKIGSNQPQKSQFEEEVLEKLTQDIGNLKENNSEKDQQWERPPLGEFDQKTQNICFQQIDAEESTLAGKPAIRLFGVTEVISFSCSEFARQLTFEYRLDNLYASTSPDSNIIYTLPPPSASPKMTVSLTKDSWRQSWASKCLSSKMLSSQCGKTSTDSRGIRRAGTSKSQSPSREMPLDCGAR
jgi:hypothetical protein